MRFEFTLLLYAVAVAALTTRPVVNTSVGSFHGARRTLSNASQDIFYGVPYAQAPLGDLRFARPVPVNTTAATVHNNTAPAKVCYQPVGWGGTNITLADMSEDCLILDVYRPAGTSAGSLLP